MSHTGEANMYNFKFKKMCRTVLQKKCINVTLKSISGFTQTLWMRPAADGKTLFWWREVLVLMDRSLLLWGECLKQFVTRTRGVRHSFLLALGPWRHLAHAYI